MKIHNYKCTCTYAFHSKEINFNDQISKKLHLTFRNHKNTNSKKNIDNLSDEICNYFNRNDYINLKITNNSVLCRYTIIVTKVLYF